MNEPVITINGTAITPAMSMTIRVALTDFKLILADNWCDGDELCKEAGRLYLLRIEEIERLIYNSNTNGCDTK